jgi:hypothetical protein
VSVHRSDVRNESLGTERRTVQKGEVERWLANLLSTRNVRARDLVVVELEQSTHQLAFFRERAAAVMVGTSVLKADPSLTSEDHNNIAA